MRPTLYPPVVLLCTSQFLHVAPTNAQTEVAREVKNQIHVESEIFLEQELLASPKTTIAGPDSTRPFTPSQRSAGSI